MTAVELIGRERLKPRQKPRLLSRHMPVLHLRLILGALATVSVASGLLLWLWAAWTDRTEALDKAASDSNFLARVVEQQTRSVIFGALSVVNAAAHRLEVAEASSSPATTLAVEDELRSIPTMQPGIEALQIAAPDGTLLFSTDPADRGERIDAQTVAAHEAGHAVEVSAATILPNGASYFTVSLTHAHDGQQRSIILAKIDLAAFHAFRKSLQTDDTTLLGVMRDDAQLVERTPLGVVRSHQSFRELPLFTQHLLNRSEGTYRTKSAIDGVDRIMSYRRVEGFPLIVFAGISRHEALAGFWRKQVRSAIYLSAALAAIGFLTWVMFRNVARDQAVRRRSVALARDLALAIQTAELGTFDYDVTTRAMSWGGALRRLFGIDEGKQATVGAFLGRIHPDDRAAELRAFRLALSPAAGAVFQREFRVVSGGEIRWVELHGQVFHGRPVEGRAVTQRVVGIVQDVTGRHELIAKKESILREVNHRVMNSLQVLCSILSLQARTIPDPGERQRFDNAARRVASLATVHGRLFRTQNMEKVEVGNYLAGLCSDLSLALIDGHCLSVQGQSSGSVLATTDEIMPLGLVVTELVNGAARHISAQRRTGEVSLRFDARPTGSRLAIMVLGPLMDAPDVPRSDGGLPDWCDPFGLSLAEMMIEQIGGQLPLAERSGNKVVIDLPWLSTI